METLWDVANVTLGVGSFVDNVKQGNVGDAVLDGLGVAADAAVILPGVPGGAGAAINGAQATAAFSFDGQNTLHFGLIQSLYPQKFARNQICH